MKSCLVAGRMHGSAGGACVSSLGRRWPARQQSKVPGLIFNNAELMETLNAILLTKDPWCIAEWQQIWEWPQPWDEARCIP